MSVFKKLNEARMALQNTKLNKSGHNNFAGYQYFELSDFLPSINQIFSDIGLCGVISFEEHLATLTITDVDDLSYIVITSPMKEANLKGCHPIQNLGAVETYTRRYLWISALEIVEHDAIEPVAGKKEDVKKEDIKKEEVKPKTLSDDRLHNAIIKIQEGSYTIEQLTANYALTPSQLELIKDL
jgi:hypothetical protein